MEIEHEMSGGSVMDAVPANKAAFMDHMKDTEKLSEEESEYLWEAAHCPSPPTFRLVSSG